MKVIANRLKVVILKLIALKQVGLIVGRNMSDNITIAQEDIHSMREKSRKWLTVKIDLKKAYDRATTISEFLHKVIMSTITTSTMQALWNGVPTSKFTPERRVHQGYLLSPYLFILCMEWLGHSIKAAEPSNKWTPIKLTKVGPPLSHLLFADDLVIFLRADIKHGFQKVHELGSYLGISLFHKRITNATLRFVVEKVRAKLCNWDAKQLSMARRFTLAQSVLLSIPNYFMQSMQVPKEVREEIEWLARQFIWCSNTGIRKLAPVDWGFVCQPHLCGGLGLRHLEDQNASFFIEIKV
ncbi:LINE-1 reverse transcriptase isogeny [Gossypium australe]|uniref:LINE-1 reverse transcriptase isogeny n=1 Tax=Gossypium australe TaxID=47621 RepID=A0A5B6W784_9ROSI|nr:LINE-1 reverse transcriptase isogeny [Gossypium australe]